MTTIKSKSKYVDGFVFVVPQKNVEAYIKMAKMGARLWRKHGALNYKECRGDDMEPTPPPGMKHLYFPKMMKAQDDDTVWFSYIEFRSKKHRDEVNAKVMKEMEGMKEMEMPFDMKRFAFGGFDVIVGS